jgi:large repetitive protein
LVNILVKQSTFDVSSKQTGIGQVAFDNLSSPQTSITQISVPQINSSQSGPNKRGSGQISPTEISPIQTNGVEESFNEIGSTQVNPFHIGIRQIQPVEGDSTQASIYNLNDTQLVTSKISDSSSIEFKDVGILKRWLTDHTLAPKSIFDVSNTSFGFWESSLLSSFNLNLVIRDLPTGQLAEANITGFDSTGRPNSGTLYLDTDANGLGWYIDPTPWDNTEFGTSLTDTAYRATVDSLAYGHYDLLTTLLHETSHLQGFIAGYNGFDSHIQTLNGSKTFVGDGFSAILTPDGSHLNSSVYTYDLMNTTLTPGVRKLPSALDIQILNAIHNAQFATHSADLAPTAALSAGALIGIDNGSFDTNTDWTTRGDTHILNGQAILSEDSPYLSHLSQTFVIPQGAKALQFTLVNTDLHSSNTRLAPSDNLSQAQSLDL